MHEIIIVWKAHHNGLGFYLNFHLLIFFLFPMNNASFQMASKSRLFDMLNKKTFILSSYKYKLCSQCVFKLLKYVFAAQRRHRVRSRGKWSTAFNCPNIGSS